MILGNCKVQNYVPTIQACSFSQYIKAKALEPIKMTGRYHSERSRNG